MVWKNLAQLDNEAPINYCNDSSNSWLMILLIGVKRFLRLSKRSVKIPHVKNWPNRLWEETSIFYFHLIYLFKQCLAIFGNCQHWGKYYFQRFSTLGQNKAQLKAKQFQTRLSFSAKYSLPLGIESANILSWTFFLSSCTYSKFLE